MKNIAKNRIKIKNLTVKFAENYLKEGIKNFTGNKDMENMFKADYKDIVKIGKLIEENKLHLASRRYDNLDSIVRESFPLTICDFLSEHTNSVWAEIYSSRA